MDDKIVKLKAATESAKDAMDQSERELKDSQERLDLAKQLLQSMDKKDQEKIKIGDTKYPELLALHQIALDNFETSQKRYETNKRYLEKFTTAAAAAARS